MSSKRYRALKGMQDILPPDIVLWQQIEVSAREIFSLYGFRELRPPLLESTEVFTRSIGENTDIVEKEMYTFSDKAGRSISLRPEGTASVVRCYVENHLHTEASPQKYYYTGPMFRYERPQSGRFRQFYQIGVEAFGSGNPRMDAETIAMLMQFLGRLGLADLVLQLNSIGCDECRPRYKESLLRFFSGKLETLCPDCSRRYHVNPLRILDCKVDRCREIRRDAPDISVFLCSTCRAHSGELESLLSLLGIAFRVDREMVRGLDYYTRTIFEVTSGALGAQNAVAAGGRYDNLVGEFGGPDTPAVGFAVGMERLVDIVKKSATVEVPVPLVFIAVVGDAADREGTLLAHQLRGRGMWIEIGDPAASLKSQMRRADRLSADYVFIMGEEEVSAQRLKWKRLSDSASGEVSMTDAPGFAEEISGGGVSGKTV